jgi:hypothetical protein
MFRFYPAVMKNILSQIFAAALILSQINNAFGVTPKQSSFFPRGIPVATTCPFGTSTPNDGCQALYASGLQGTVQYPNCFTTDPICVGSQTRLSRLQENQAGVDYPVGVPASMAGSLKDPATNPITNCTYNPTGSAAGGPKLDCSGGAVVVHGYEFGPIGGHQATVFKLENTVTSTDIQYNHFGADSNTAGSSDLNDYAVFLGAPGSTFNLVFSHNTIDANCHPSPGTCVGNYGIQMLTLGSITFDYDALLWLPFRMNAGCGSGACPTVGDVNFRWTIMVGPTASSLGVHGEWIERVFSAAGTPTTQTNTNYIGDVMVIPPNTNPNITTNLYISDGGTGNGLPEYTNVNITDTTLISNLPGGGNQSMVTFQNGNYVHVNFQNVALDMTGASGHNFRADCGNALFGGSHVNGTTGEITVTGWISSWGTIKVGMMLALNNVPTSYTLTSFGTGTGGNGTYESDYTGPDLDVPIVGVGGHATAIFPNGVTMTNVIDMSQAAPSNTITTWNDKNTCTGIWGPP